jgi:hypothetical protein
MLIRNITGERIFLSFQFTPLQHIKKFLGSILIKRSPHLLYRVLGKRPAKLNRELLASCRTRKKYLKNSVKK